MADTSAAKKAERVKPASVGNAHAAAYYRNPVGQTQSRLIWLIEKLRKTKDSAEVREKAAAR
jgi:hypothetical protein